MELTTTATRVHALACAMAVLGDDTPAAAATRLAGLRPDDGERAADELAAAGILASRRPLRFAHPIMRAALYAYLPAGERAIAHRRAVRVLGDAGADPMIVVAHACAVEPAGDPFVAEALLAAGRSALAAGAPRQAALLVERALAEPPPVAERAAARVLLGRALTLLGDRRAPGLTAEALAGAAPHERERIAAELVDALWLSGAADAAVSLARETAGAEGAEPAGIAAARAARDGTLPADEIGRTAAAGVGGATALERCCAIAALIACDALDEAGRALAACTSAAAARGAGAELALLARLRMRLRDVARGGRRVAEGGESTWLLPGPDPGAAPWLRWLSDPAAAERFGTPSARGAALLAAGDVVRAVEVLRSSPREVLLATALLALGRTLRHAGERRAARAALAEALDLAQRHGLASLGAEAGDELRVAGARPRREQLSGPASLTAAERRVADAAATGWTNRDIAERLFLSPKTVEMHLGRVYRKLDIRSRSGLAVALGAPSPEPRDLEPGRGRAVAA